MPSDALPIYDSAIIGAGPAGLTAAIYLARYRRSVIVFDGGSSRAQWIPESHNCPGFPGGISGVTLLQRLRTQLDAYEAPVCEDRIVALEQRNEHFGLVAGSGRGFAARTVVIATGIVDVLPDVDWIEAAVQVGAVRLCAICDGFEVTDQRIAVYGPSTSALGHALFLRTYSADVSIVCSDQRGLDRADADRATSAGVGVIDQTDQLLFDGRRCTFVSNNGATATFDSVYPYLGCRVQSALAKDLGAACDDKGSLEVSSDQMTSVSGLYAAGDVVSDLNQISVAVGQSGTAATAIHNALPSNMKAGDGSISEEAYEHAST